MEESSLSYKTLKNVSFSFLGYVLPILFSIFITPIVVHKLGTVDYGIYVLVNTITGTLLLLDLGLGTALLKFGAQYHAQNDGKNLQALLGSANSIFALFGVVGLIVFFALGKFFLPIFHISGSSQSHILVVFMLSGILFLLNSLNTFYISIFKAVQRYDFAVSLNLAQLVVLNFFVLGLMLVGYKLKAILAINIFTLIPLVLAQHYYAKKLLPDISLAFTWSARHIRDSYRFGVAAFITNISGSALTQLDRLIIPMFLGPSALTYYSLPGNVAQKVSGITGTSSSIFFPMMSALASTGEQEKIKSIYTKLIRNVTIVVAGISVPIFFFAHKILQFWVGESFALQGTGILKILVATYFILALQGPLINFLLGLSRVRFLMKYSVFMAVLNFLLLLWWVPAYGITGAAWAYFVAVLPIAAMFYWVEKKFLSLKGRFYFYMVLYAKLALVAVVFWLIASLFDRFVTSFTAMVVAGPIAVVVFFALFWLFGFMDKEDRELYSHFFVAAKRKFKM